VSSTDERLENAVPDLSATYPPPTAYRRRRRLPRGILLTLVILAVLAVAAVVISLVVRGPSSPDAQVGDCVAQPAKPTDLDTVDCSDPKAAYKVVAVIDGTRSQAQANDETHPCARFKDAITSLWSGETGEKGPQPTDPGTIFCLRPAK
jgi:hypothetical protein